MWTDRITLICCINSYSMPVNGPHTDSKTIMFVCGGVYCMSFRYDLPQYGSRRKLISPAGTYDEYGEVIVEDDGSYYYSPHESEGEVAESCFYSAHFHQYCKQQHINI